MILTAKNLLTPAVLSTIPMPASISQSLDKQVTKALIGQNAVTASSQFTNIIKNGYEIATDYKGKRTIFLGILAQTPEQLVLSGVMKKGADKAISLSIRDNKSLSLMVPPSVFTGKYEISNISSFLKNTTAQVKAKIDLFKYCLEQLIKREVITGNEEVTYLSGILNVAANTSIEIAQQAKKEGKI